MVEVIDKVLSTYPEKQRFYSELEKMQIQPRDIPNNLYAFHQALKGAFGKDHYSIESLIIKTLHEDTKKGIYSEKNSGPAAICLLDVFTKENQKDIDDSIKRSKKHNVTQNDAPPIP